MKLKNYLDSLRTTIDESLDKYLPKEQEEPRIIHKAMRHSVFSGGKRIRPILAVECSNICGGHLEGILPIACAIELAHTYSLIHDDLPSMDNDDYRRGMPTCHKAFGEANAVLAGDGLLTLAFEIILKYSRAKIAIGAAKELASAIGTRGMVGGQAADLEFSISSIRARAALNYINYLKTGRLFQASTKLGALAANSTERKIDALAEFGSAFGMAFQIIDDIIDNEGCAKIFGASKARRDAEALTKKSKCALRIFGRKADTLKAIADYILNRPN